MIGSPLSLRHHPQKRRSGAEWSGVESSRDPRGGGDSCRRRVHPRSQIRYFGWCASSSAAAPPRDRSRELTPPDYTPRRRQMKARSAAAAAAPAPDNHRHGDDLNPKLV